MQVTFFPSFLVIMMKLPGKGFKRYLHVTKITPFTIKIHSLTHCLSFRCCCFRLKAFLTRSKRNAARSMVSEGDFSFFTA